jgi:hypothetical protein
MPRIRNYTKENAWQKNSYVRFIASLKHDEADKLKNILINYDNKFSSWVRDMIKKETVSD